MIPSFQRHLRAENKSPKTIQSYTEAVRMLHDFCSGNGMPLEVANITSEHIEAFLSDQLARLRPACSPRPVRIAAGVLRLARQPGRA